MPQPMDLLKSALAERQAKVRSPNWSFQLELLVIRGSPNLFINLLVMLLLQVTGSPKVMIQSFSSDYFWFVWDMAFSVLLQASLDSSGRKQMTHRMRTTETSHFLFAETRHPFPCIYGELKLSPQRLHLSLQHLSTVAKQVVCILCLYSQLFELFLVHMV